MKKLLLLLAVCLWGSSYAQIPELIYYQFNRSGNTVENHALLPVGLNPAPIQGNLTTAPGGFLSSRALQGDGSQAANNNISTGWNTRINGSFTLAFWTRDSPVNTRLNYIFGDKQAGEFRCFTNGVAGVGNWLVRGGELPDLPVKGAATMAPRMIHIVYDSAAATYTSFVNGIQNTQVSVDSVPDVTGSGLIIGGYLDNHGLNGKLDEIRWYNRALSVSEIANTWDKDLNILGNCPPFSSFSLDTITADAVQLSWQPGSNNSGYYLEYGLKGFQPGQGILLTGSYPASLPPVLISGLQPNTDYELYFGEFCGNGDSAYLPGPVSFSTTRLCATPTQFVAGTPNTTSIPVSWSNSAITNSHQLIYGFQGFNPALGGQSLVATGNSQLISGLSPATAYDIYLAADCGATKGGSDTIGPLQVTTLCAPVTAFPWREDFEPGLPNQPGTLPQCWQTQSASDLAWMINKGSTPSAATGPDKDKTTDSLNGHYMYLETSYSGASAYLYTPEFDIRNLTNPSISFWYHMFGNSTGSLQLQVSVNGGQSWVTIADLQGEQHWGHKDAWKKITVDIRPFVAANTSFRFVGNRGGSFTGDIAVDEVVVEDGSACMLPAAFFISATDSTADFRLIGGGNSYGIEWGLAGFVPGTGCRNLVTNGVFTISNALDTSCTPIISGNRLLDLYVWNECNPSDKIKISFSTACSGFNAPYVTNFDNHTRYRVPDCWSGLIGGNSHSGGAVEVYDFSSPASAPNHLRLYNGAGQDAGDTAAVISPLFQDMILADKQLRFSAKSSKQGTQLWVGTWHGSRVSPFDPLDTVVLDDSYHQYTIALTAANGYNGQDQHIAFMHAQGESFNTIFIDDFYYETQPACLPPSAFKVTDVSFNSAKLAWGTAGQGQKTRLEWAMPGFTPGAGQALGFSSVSGNLTSTVISGLAPGTTYEVYLQDSCDFDDLSPWIGPLQFTTNCAPVTAPYLESFDDSNWQAGPSSSEGDAINACWRRNPGADGTYKWGVFNALTPSLNTGPLKDHSGQGNFIYTEASAGNTDDTAWFFTPWVDLSSLSRPGLEFYVHRYGNDLPEVRVEVRNMTSGWDSLLTLDTEIQNSESAGFVPVLARLSNWGDTVQVRFRAISKGCCAGDMALDELRFDEAPSCPAVTGLQAFGTSDSTATARWDSTLDAQQYEVWIGKPGSFNLQAGAAGTRTVTAMSSLNIDTLSAASCYEIRVRAICAPGDSSNWSQPVEFCSLCDAVAAPQTQNFDSLYAGQAGDLGNCWTTSNIDLLSYGWRVHSGTTTSGNTGPLGDAGSGSGYYLYTEASVGAQGDEAILKSPPMDLSALSQPELRFSYHMYGSDIDTLHLDVRDDQGWHNNVMNISGPQHFHNTDPWSDTLVNLGTYSGKVQLRFRTYRGNGFRGDLALDEITVADPITCPQPTQLDTSQVTANTATLHWEGGVSGNYQVAYARAIASIQGASYAIVNTNRLSLTGLAGGSQYGFFVRKICAPGDTSQWAGPFYFYTDCVPLVNAPYYANFEGLGASASANLANCWDVFSPQGLRWESEVATGYDHNTVSTGPDFDNTLYPAPMGTYVFLETSLSGSYAELISPTIDASGLQNPELVYHFHMYGQDINKLEVYLESNANGSRFLIDSITGQKQVMGSMPFWERRIDLSGFPITTYRVIFKAYKGGGFKGDIAIDDVWIDEAGANTCVKPPSLAVGAVGCDSISLSWATTSGQSVVEYGPSGFSAGNGSFISASGNSVVIRGLAPNTDYDVRIANICGTDTSAFERRNQITTLSAPKPVAVISYTDSIFASKNHSAKYFTFDASQSQNATSYYWDFDNGQTSTAAEVMTFFVFNQNYEVMLVASNGCGTDTARVKVNVDINVDETPLSKSLELYPNPASGMVHLSFNTVKDGRATVRLSDVTGKEVFTRSEENINGRFNQQFDVSKLPAGIYLLEVDDGEYSASRKLIRTY